MSITFLDVQDHVNFTLT